jgi:hypothetical protein
MEEKIKSKKIGIRKEKVKSKKIGIRKKKKKKKYLTAERKEKIKKGLIITSNVLQETRKNIIKGVAGYERNKPMKKRRRSSNFLPRLY